MNMAIHPTCIPIFRFCVEGLSKILDSIILYWCGGKLSPLVLKPDQHSTKELEHRLVTTQRAMKRQMLHTTLRDKIRNTTIRCKTKVKNIQEKV